MIVGCVSYFLLFVRCAVFSTMSQVLLEVEIAKKRKEQCFKWILTRVKRDFDMSKKEKSEVPPRFELGSLESRVLTATP
ncbi:hypothetical protein L596_018411 [Steinernema carpocapsae]|uniref:Uncharacterized protein n=1 Tax=Steinernema carpocapsae TaxID=34508 RepID=A0A4U5N4J3_STECR|nr:hypothetical protein L596_018411 [Steinernema carpocapsae]